MDSYDTVNQNTAEFLCNKRFYCVNLSQVSFLITT